MSMNEYAKGKEKLTQGMHIMLLYAKLIFVCNKGAMRADSRQFVVDYDRLNDSSIH